MTDQSRDASRISKALELEELARVKAMQEINEDSNRAEQEAVSDFAARGSLQSGKFGGKIAENTYNPEIGSEADEQAQRLEKRGLLKAGPMGGYMIARLF